MKPKRKTSEERIPESSPRPKRRDSGIMERVSATVTCAPGVVGAYAEVMSEALKAAGIRLHKGDGNVVRLVFVNRTNTPHDVEGLGSTPTVIVSVDNRTEISEWIDAGADDAVLLTNGLKEIAARIRAVGRRAPVERTSITIEELTIDWGRKQVRVDGELVTLTALQAKLMFYLAQRFEQWVTVQEIHTYVCETPICEGSGARGHVRQIRMKLGAAKRFLKSNKGWGYGVWRASEE